jgi:hypothetical protein
VIVATLVIVVLAGLAFAVLRRHPSSSRVHVVSPSTTTPTTVPEAASTTTLPAVQEFSDGIFPFVDAAAVTAYLQSGGHAYSEPVAVTDAFARVFVGMPHPVLGSFRRTDPTRGTVTVRPSASAGATSVVTLREIVPGGPWTVVGSAADEIVVDRPTAGAAVSSPVPLSGRSTAFEATVSVEVRHLAGATAGETVGRATVMGGANGTMGPFHGQVSYRSPATGTGALLLLEHSAEDGTPIDATVVRVRLGAA